MPHQDPDSHAPVSRDACIKLQDLTTELPELPSRTRGVR